ncbi:hypothetical protein Vadar_022967 [Vaccinium darrowii]|uniref:Uncharacterized protein n=1 Tax=Vaccinium darrowii TaxID=229202 RepID=A0ACB7YXI7_9ERIC|nr:hypothetical protein Vadar_022967 [Vaccinium darrowii]
MSAFKKLCCRRPNSPNQVEFEITPERNCDNKFYEIQCSSGVSSTEYYSVEKLNEKKQYSLEVQPFDFTLDEWLKDKNELWNEQWGQYCPKDDVRRVIQGMITAVCALHEENRFHGGLDRLENYSLRFYTSYTGEEETSGVKVMLIHKSFGSNTKLISTDLGDPLCIEREMYKDMSKFESVIFDQILKVGNLPIARDLQDLRDRMKIGSASHQFPEIHRRFVASHPSLWPAKAKLHFFVKIWSAYERGKNGLPQSMKRKVKVAMINMTCAKNWHTRVPMNGPLRKLLERGTGAPFYCNTEINLLYFMRNVICHINDKDEKGNRLYIDEVEAVEQGYSEEYILKILDDTFPLLLTTLYGEMYRVGAVAKLYEDV